MRHSGYPAYEATWTPQAQLEPTVFKEFYEQFKARAKSEGLRIPSSWPNGTTVLLEEAIEAGWV